MIEDSTTTAAQCKKMSITHNRRKYPNRKKPPPFSKEHLLHLHLAKMSNTCCVGREPWNKRLTGVQKSKYKGKPMYWMQQEKHHAWKNGISANQTLAGRENLAGRKKSERCEICGALGKDLKKGLCFDHSHTTNKFRGWICQRCNLVLGHVKDDTELLIKLTKYLQRTNI